ncbi:MAG TPA: beta-1,3-glucanase family protein, partial [Bacteroidia bacterium]|nr:beta-1,3-glucanase family protein [Bacteroidia bacterium]
MFTTSLVIGKSALAFGNIHAIMYGQLLEAYTPSHGPQKGTALGKDTWVYLSAGANPDYATAPSAGSSVEAFNVYDAPGTYSIGLPAVQIQSAHIVFGFGANPSVISDATGAPQQPSPLTATCVYDFVEFTYNASNTLYLNTTMIDQFGMPIRIQVDPADAVLPQGAGVIPQREFVFKSYSSFINSNPANAAYAQCMNDPFGNALTERILSPKYVIFGNGVSGVSLSLLNQGKNPPVSTLPQGTYYYAVTALNANGKETFAQYLVSSITLPEANVAVNIAWAPNDMQPAGTVSYNVYRGTPGGNSVSWVCVTNVPASNFPPGAGGAVADLGTTLNSNAPTFNPLNTAFDAEITTFFTTYLSTAKSPTSLTLTASDGTSDGYVFTFTGYSHSDSNGNITHLSMLLESVVDSAGGTVSAPPIPLQTAFNIYYPFWNTNTFNQNKPSPPSWTVYPNDPASVMVLAAQGVFADNTAQPVPPGVTAANTVIYQTLLGNLENQVVAAITRGIANQPGNPQNWGN